MVAEGAAQYRVGRAATMVHSAEVVVHDSATMMMEAGRTGETILSFLLGSLLFPFALLATLASTAARRGGTLVVVHGEVSDDPPIYNKISYKCKQYPTRLN